jgi:hypothetical protein
MVDDRDITDPSSSSCVVPSLLGIHLLLGAFACVALLSILNSGVVAILVVHSAIAILGIVLQLRQHAKTSLSLQASDFFLLAGIGLGFMGWDVFVLVLSLLLIFSEQVAVYISLYFCGLLGVTLVCSALLRRGHRAWNERLASGIIDLKVGVVKVGRASVQCRASKVDMGLWSYIMALAAVFGMGLRRFIGSAPTLVVAAIIGCLCSLWALEQAMVCIVTFRKKAQQWERDSNKRLSIDGGEK